ncbi:type IX secretion/gliding motility protein PorT/SprT [Foetidibacter luteolus]|uniref:type IX secretion/gliding motility protein PorT/SprT n=1 Tax=Foetidibacter luteolus TaxID=2608880 RepID=UPI001F2DA692|nr:outer membrane beta-barrel protein [Foetidibacter luteolus]
MPDNRKKYLFTDFKIDRLLIYFLRKHTVLLALGICCFLSAAAQRELHRPNHDNMPYYFGMSLAYNNSTLHGTKHPLFLQNDSIMRVEPGSSGGIALGLLGTLKLSKRFEARLNPTLIIGGAKYFTYWLKNPIRGEKAVEKKTLPSTIVSFPLQFKFNSDRIDNFRVYLLAGVKYDMDLASNSTARNAEDLVKLKKYDAGYEVGIGFNFYLPFVTVSPELKISNGLGNIHSRDPNLKYSSVLDKLQSKMIVFTINLED